MKQITQLLAVAALLLLTACNPMEPIYKQLDSVDHPIQKSIAYALTDADYKTIAAAFAKAEVAGYTGSSKEEFAKEVQREANYVKTNRTLTAWVSPEKYVPALMAKMYPEWGKGSAVTVSYAMQQHPAEDAALDKLISVNVSADDATKAGLTAKDPNNLSKDEINKLGKYLATTYADKGTSYLAKVALAEGQRNMLFIGERLADSRTYKVISPAEYQAMGTTHDNFSSSELPERYIPQLLQQSMPYAQPGNQLIVVYEWFENKFTTPEYQSFKLEGNQWRVAQTTSQFVNLGKQWIFDPTVRFTLTADDFMILHAWVKANKPDYISKDYSSDSEWWFCGSAHYKNFNIDGGKSLGARPDEEGKSAEDLFKLRLERIKEGLKLILKARYADKPAQTNGIDQMYVITTGLRKNYTNSTVTFTYKGLGGGNFEYVSGPNAI
ncbi:hypothetical protein [Porphyromonas uenonis]|uniref:hypothetical protein n=1 Tax=Porphyromonas uenonis TaxID=281920 RepID=UPI0026EA68D2|nr:hypothetical protein [Porphyromonas uenonis]